MSLEDEFVDETSLDSLSSLLTKEEHETMSTALVMVKCRHVDQYWDIATVLRTVGYNVPTYTRTKIGTAIAHALYKEHAGRDYFSGLIESVTSGDVALLVVQGKTTPTFYAELRKLVGPTDPVVARSDKPTSLRGRFTSEGDTLPHNAIHCSDSYESACRELELMYKLI